MSVAERLAARLVGLVASRLGVVEPRDRLEEDAALGVSIRAGAMLKHMREPAPIKERMVGETLSVAVHEPSSIALATTPDANLVTLWDLKQRRLLRSIDLEHPRGVTLTRDQRYFVVSCGLTPKLLYLSTRDFSVEESRTVAGANLSSSHIYTHVV